MRNFTQSVKGDIQHGLGLLRWAKLPSFKLRKPHSIDQSTKNLAVRTNLRTVCAGSHKDAQKAQIICEASLVHAGPLLARPKSHVVTQKSATSARTVALSIPSHGRFSGHHRFASGFIVTNAERKRANGGPSVVLLFFEEQGPCQKYRTLAVVAKSPLAH